MIRCKRAYEDPDPVEQVEELLAARREAGTLTLVYGARDTEHNNAVALREHLLQHDRER